jgi:alcohol dehydrogenase
MPFQMFVPTKALFGQGQLNNLHAQELPGKKALIIVSNGKSVKVNGYLARTEKELHLAGVETALFDEVEANPLKTTVMRGGQAAREKACDFLVALGGGSCMDAAKAIAVVATNDGDLWDYISQGTGKGNPIANKPLPIVAITTTAGTGSETDMGGVITNEETNEKTPVKSPDLFPVLAIIDPELMATVPPKFTAYQGFDALFHNIEGYLSNKANLMSEMVELKAIQQISAYLPEAVHNGGNMTARERVAFGNYLGGIEMCLSGNMSEHSLEHALSAYHQELPHGAGLIMLSKAYFSFMIEHHVCDERFIRLAQKMGIPHASTPADFIKALDRLIERCDVDGLKMSDYGIQPDEFPKMAENAKSAMGMLFGNDRIELSIDDCVSIFKAAYR